MEFSPTMIVIALVAFGLGYLFRIVDSRFTAAAKKKFEKPAHPVEVVKEVIREVEVFKERGVPGETAVLLASVDQAQKWHLELDGVRLEEVSGMSVEQRQRLISVIVQIRPWIDGKPAAPAPIAAPAPAPVVAPTPVQTPPPAPVAAAPAAKPAPAVPAPPKIDPIRGLQTMVRGEAKSPAAIKSKSIVAMIDEVLQNKLMTSPLFSKGIRLEEGPMGEVNVFVGVERYAGIDAVPDPEVRAIIKAAIADWEK
jgi:hypothetical protein